MALCWPNLILLIWAFVAHASATTYSLTAELTKFVPVCAQECFISFLQSNFPAELCSTTPSLDCVCSHNSTTGYTVGEGAVQCLISEDNIGFCQGNDAKDSVVVAAYSMCNDQASALPNTHATITATLVIETSMPSIVLVASVAVSTTAAGSDVVTTTETQSSTAISTQILTATSTTSVLPTTFVIATGSPTQSRPSSTSGEAASSSSSAAATTAAVPLSKPQVVGIAVGSFGGAAAGIGLLVLLICLRRRRQKRNRDSDMLPFQLDPDNRLTPTTRYSHNLRRSFKRGPERTPSGMAAKVHHRTPPPIPLRLETSPSNMFSRRTMRPDEREAEPIGPAISPSTPAVSQGERTPHRSSRLLPDKPNLSLAVPPPVVLKSAPPPRQDSMMSRQSTVTTFEEDEDSAITPGYSGSWSPRPMPLTIKTVARPERQASQSKAPKPTTLFIDDHDEELPGGSSGRRNMEQEYQIKPLSLGRAASFSQPRRPAAFPTSILTLPSGPKLGPSSSLRVPAQSPRMISNTSSMYSTRGSSTVSSTPSLNLNSNSVGRKSYKVIGPYEGQKAQNHISNTSWTSSLETDDDYEPFVPPIRELSPVVESPASGTSPVKYPKIPLRLSGTAMFGERPRQTDYSRTLGEVVEERHSQLEPAKVKPTIRVVDPPQYTEKELPETTGGAKQAEIDVRKERRASRQLSKSQLQPFPSLGHMTTARPQHARQLSRESSGKVPSPGPPPYTQELSAPAPPEKTAIVKPEETFTPPPAPTIARARFSFQLPPTPPTTVSPTPKSKAVQKEGIHIITSHFQTSPTPTPPPPSLQSNPPVQATAAQNPTPTPAPGSGFTRQPTAPSSENQQATITSPSRPAPAPIAPTTSPKQKLHLYTGPTSPSHDYPYPPPPSPPKSASPPPRNHLRTLPSQKGAKQPQPYTSPHGFHPVTTTTVPAHDTRPLTDATGGFSIFPSSSPYTQNPPLPFNLLTHSPLSPHKTEISPIEQAQRTLRLENERKYPIRTSSKASTSSSLLAKRRGERMAEELVLMDEKRGSKDSKGKGRGSPSKWRVLKPEEISNAKRGDWKPMASVHVSPRLSPNLNPNSNSNTHISPNFLSPNTARRSPSPRENGESSRSPTLRRTGPGNLDLKLRRKEGEEEVLGLGVGLSGRKDSERIRDEVQKAGYTREVEWEMERGELPATPGWRPHLTPTRRGGELFLSVR